MAKKQPKIGRPPKPPGQKLARRVTVKLAPAQYAALVAAAERNGTPLAEFVRRAAMAAAG